MDIDYATMIARYKADYVPEDNEWFAHSRRLGLRQAIEQAALARGPNGEKFSHQRRIPPTVLERAKQALLAQQEAIAICTSFDDLHRLIEVTAGPIPGFGELATYDTSIRLGAHLDLWPDKIYLHAGTRDGYAAIGGDPGALFARLDEMPAALRALKPHEIEDILCIYKGELQGKIRSGDPQFCQPRRKRKGC